MSDSSSPYGVPPSQARELAQEPSFLERLVQLPFRPAMWRVCSGLSVGRVLLPLALLVLAADTVTGFLYARDVRDNVYAVAKEYDDTADPLILEDGRFRLDGTRIFHRVQDDFTVLVDPEGTVPDGEIETTGYLVVRSDSVTTNTRRFGAQELAALAGEGPIVFDGGMLREFADSFLYPVIVLTTAVFLTLFDVCLCAAYAVAAGALLYLVRGQYLGLQFPQCFNVALAASAATVVLNLALIASDTAAPLAGPLLWTAVMLGLGVVALRGVPAPHDPASAPLS